MDSNDIVPDVLDEGPSQKLTVIYNGKNLEIGHELTPREVKDEPKVSWSAQPNKYYFLAMVDPDAPSRKEPIYREVNHWGVGNILGNDLSGGQVIVGYRGSGPPKGTGLHRYIFLVYEQQGKIQFEEPFIPSDVRDGRINFSIRNFAQKYNLGKPLFGNYFQAQFDSYVEERLKNEKSKQK